MEGLYLSPSSAAVGTSSLAFKEKRRRNRPQILTQVPGNSQLTHPTWWNHAGHTINLPLAERSPESNHRLGPRDQFRWEEIS